MTTVLAGDIGGTKTILRLVKAEPDSSNLINLHEATYLSRDFSDLVPLVGEFLSTGKDKLPELPHPERACFGIAGPVIDRRCELTNLSWSLDEQRLEEELAIAKVKLINDFAAIGYSILGLSSEDLFTLQDVQPDPNAPIALIGAGTGLGEGFLIPLPDGGYRVFASEGSHADFAPRSPIEFQLLSYLLEANNLERVSVERIVSGMGIISIYEFIGDREPSLESPAMAEIYKTWKQELEQEVKTIDLAAEIAQAALSGQDCLCQQTMKIFIEAYGAVAGNLALTLLPYGGLYVAGGIAAKILPLIREGEFMKAFKAKGRVSSLMERIPVHVLSNPKVGLVGAALCAAQMLGES